MKLRIVLAGLAAAVALVGLSSDAAAGANMNGAILGSGYPNGAYLNGAYLNGAPRAARRATFATLATRPLLKK